MDQATQNSVKQLSDRQLSGLTRTKDKSDRATVETVLDPRTRLVRFLYDF